MTDSKVKFEIVTRLDAWGVYNEPVDYSFRNLMKFEGYFKFCKN
jgi:hypothetical protein